MSELPLVSILIPCFNAEAWIRQSVESALRQTHLNKEVIVIDDGSTDKSLEVLREFGSAIQLETGANRGGNVARNRLLALSKGEWLQYLDADDYLLPDKIERQIEYLRQNPSVDVVYSPLIMRVEESGTESTTTIAEKEDAIYNYLSWGPFSTNSVLFRRKSVADVGGWKETQKVCQEHELLSRLILSGCKFGLFDVPGSVYRFHGNHTVSTRSRDVVIRQRMMLADRLSEYLNSTGQMNLLRRGALARGRFEAARQMYFIDRPYARSLMRLALKDRPIPTSDAAPLSYQTTLALLGFDMAEWIARIKRVIKRGTQP